MPVFLELPDRSAKPRANGLTHVLDKGVAPAAAAALLDAAGDFIDIWKIGWGIAYVDTGLEAKLELLAAHDVGACLGGTLLELAWRQGKAAECLAWAADVGFVRVEVSRGSVDMTLAEKRELIELAARRFLVLSEVGAKDPASSPGPAEWGLEAAADREAGAALVVAEGRESGTVGIYERDGGVRTGVVDALVAAVGVSRVLFEAPRKEQQAWFVREFGPGVNLGNIPLEEAVSLETLRLGLRSDTMNHVAAREAEPCR
jgi:phosphosulfolactate synthase